MPDLINSAKISFDGVVGDLGSRDICTTFIGVRIENKLSEDDFAERCRKKFVGKKILDEKFEKNKQGVLVYTAKIESKSGI